MTKLRAPVSVEAALARIEQRIGLAAMAAAVSTPEKPVTPRTVAWWAEPGTPGRLPAEHAPLLDAAYQAAGGEDAPLLDTHARLIERHRELRAADAAELADRACRLIHAGAEAEAALVVCSSPGATDADRLAALRDVELLDIEATQTLPLLTVGIGPHGGTRQGPVPGGTS